MDHCTSPSSSGARKNRTVIVYFGLFIEYLEIVGDRARYICIVAAAMAMATVEHKDGCTCSRGYTRHQKRQRVPRNFRGEQYEVPIWQIRCNECKAVFTILPSFLARYQRFDVSGLAKILEVNLIMTSSYRHTLKILGYAHGENLPFDPAQILRIVRWLGDLLPLPVILLRLGLTPPQAVLEDEKFVHENGERTYIALLSRDEVIWWIEYLKDTDEVHLQACFESYRTQVREFYPGYDIAGATYDGWAPAKAAFETINSDVVMQECHLHARMRMSQALPLIQKAEPYLTEEELEEIKKRHDQILQAQSTDRYSEQLSELQDDFGYIDEVNKRCRSLENKMLMFLAYLLHPLLCLAKVSTVLDQLIKFFDRKFFIMQTFRETESAKETVRAFAIVRNFWRYMPGAKRAGQSPVEIAGANLCKIPWLEVVNLATTSRMSPENHVAVLRDT